MNTVAQLFSDSSAPAGNLRTLELPGLALPTGRLVACDPLVHSDPQPFTRTCPPGRYSVYLHLLPTSGLIAYAELRISAATAVRWEIAVNAGQDPATLEADEIFGYPVDAGVGCFMDHTTVALLAQHDADLQAQLGDEYVSYFDDYVDDELSSGPAPTGHDNCLLQPYPDRENNVAVFQSGYGDGFYETYVGLNAAGQPVKFVTEFIDAAAAG